MATDATMEITAGDRFGFGDNWARFLELLDDDRIAAAEDSLRSRLDVTRSRRPHVLRRGLRVRVVLPGRDRNLGATVHSFDFDPQSVACTAELRRRYHPDHPGWTVEQASVLDSTYLEGRDVRRRLLLGRAPPHGRHVGRLRDVEPLVAPRGRLFIAIYNDQGGASRRWRRVKKRYNQVGPLGQRTIVAGARAYFELRAVLLRATPSPSSTPSSPSTGSVADRADDQRARGMDRDRDLVDWVGGWPFEVAKPEAIFDLYRERGFTLVHLSTCGGGLGCNEFVFRRERPTAPAGGRSDQADAGVAALDAADLDGPGPPCAARRGRGTPRRRGPRRPCRCPG